MRFTCALAVAFAVIFEADAVGYDSRECGFGETAARVLETPQIRLIAPTCVKTILRPQIRKEIIAISPVRRIVPAFRIQFGSSILLPTDPGNQVCCRGNVVKYCARPVQSVRLPVVLKENYLGKTVETRCVCPVSRSLLTAGAVACRVG